MDRGKISKRPVDCYLACHTDLDGCYTSLSNPLYRLPYACKTNKRAALTGSQPLRFFWGARPYIVNGYIEIV